MALQIGYLAPEVSASSDGDGYEASAPYQHERASPKFNARESQSACPPSPTVRYSNFLLLHSVFANLLPFVQNLYFKSRGCDAYCHIDAGFTEPMMGIESFLLRGSEQS